MTQSPTARVQKRLYLFSSFAFLATILVIIWLLVIPGSAKNDWILGLSKIRLAMLAPLIGLSLLWLWMIFQNQRDPRQGEQFLQLQQGTKFKWGLQSLADACALFAPIGIYLLVKWNFFIDTGFDYQTVVQRINPYLLLITLYSLGFQFVYYPRPEANPDSSSPSLLNKIQCELLRHKTLPFILAGMAVLFVIAHFLSWRFQMDEDLKWSLLFFAQEFNLDNENVLSAYFSGFILFSAGSLLAVIAADQIARKQPMRLQWSLLSIIFIYLSIDEVFGIHEKLSLSGSGISDINQLFYFKWVPVAFIFLIIFGLLFIRFYLQLPNRSKILFALSGVMYLSGVLGVEIIAGRYMAAYNEWGYEYWKLAELEEGLEMFGAIIFNFSLLDYIRHNYHSPE